MLAALVSNSQSFVAYGCSDKINIPFANTIQCVCRYAYVYIVIVHRDIAAARESRLKSYKNKVRQNPENVEWAIGEETTQTKTQTADGGLCDTSSSEKEVVNQDRRLTTPSRARFPRSLLMVLPHLEADQDQWQIA